MKSLPGVKEIPKAARCKKSPTGAHWWFIDSGLIGRCRFCPTVRDFNKVQKKAVNQTWNTTGAPWEGKPGRGE